MSNLKLLLFFFTFSIISIVIQVLLFQEDMSKSLAIWALISGIIATGILFLTNRKTKENHS